MKEVYSALDQIAVKKEDNSLYVKSLNVNIDKLRNMDIREIEQCGASIQEMIETKSSEILSKTSVNELGETGAKLDELQSIVNKQKKLLPATSSPMRLFKRFTGNFVKVQGRIDAITDAIVLQKDKLDNYIEYMMEQTDSIGNAITQLYEVENALSGYAKELQTENSEDIIRLQVVSNRLKLITGTRVNAEQAKIESLIIIKANQESKYQLAQVVQNVVPILKMQAVNAIGIRANQESIEIAEKTRKITGDLIVKNAEDINKMAKDLQNNRTRSIIDEEKLDKAQSIILEAMTMVTKASEFEVDTNLKVAERLKMGAINNQKYINSLK